MDYSAYQFGSNVDIRHLKEPLYNRGVRRIPELRQRSEHDWRIASVVQTVDVATLGIQEYRHDIEISM